LTNLIFLAQADPEAAPQPVVPPAEAQQPVVQEPGVPEPAPREPAPWWAQNPLIPIILGIIVLYFFVFRSKRTQDRKRQDMLSQLRKGDRVQTIGGILGTVIEARDNEVLLKVDESSNTKIRFSRSAIHRVLEEETK
jgi:preprotein translocase subunit YajC